MICDNDKVMVQTKAKFKSWIYKVQWTSMRDKLHYVISDINSTNGTVSDLFKEGNERYKRKM